MSTPDKLLNLIEVFDRNAEAYRQGSINETETRVQFIDPMFELLGWDVRNTQGCSEAFKDVGGVTLKEGCEGLSLPYLQALLNSRLLMWYFPFVSAPFRGGRYSANRQFLSQIPIRPVNLKDPTDRLIDKLVCELYGLTEEEIGMVKGDIA
jgi:hypothetical protein